MVTLKRKLAPDSEPDQEEPEPLLYNVEDACRLLGNISKPTFYRKRRQGKIKVIKQGKRTMVTAEELRRYVKSLEAEQNGPAE